MSVDIKNPEERLGENLERLHKDILHNLECFKEKKALYQNDDDKLNQLRVEVKNYLSEKEEVLLFYKIRIEELKSDLFFRLKGDSKLEYFITSISFIFPNDYAEAFRGDLIEKRNQMVKHKQPRWYIWVVIIVNIGYTFWAAVWFKLKDIMDTDDVKEIDK